MPAETAGGKGWKDKEIDFPFADQSAESILRYLLTRDGLLQGQRLPIGSSQVNTTLLLYSP